MEKIDANITSTTAATAATGSFVVGPIYDPGIYSNNTSADNKTIHHTYVSIMRVFKWF